MKTSHITDKMVVPFLGGGLNTVLSQSAMSSWLECRNVELF